MLDPNRFQLAIPLFGSDLLCQAIGVTSRKYTEVRKSRKRVERVRLLRSRQRFDSTVSEWASDANTLRRMERVGSVTLVKDKLLFPVCCLFDLGLLLLVQPEALQVEIVHLGS